MTNSKSTKRALLTSVLAMLLCVLMLVGTTFAWFTDSASTGVNKIQAGNLKMEVSYKNTKGGNFTPVDKNTAVFDEDALWEPGHVEYVVLKVKNVGTLALKYKLGINIASEIGSTNVLGNTFNLSNYIKFAVLDGDQSTLDRADLVAAAGTGAAINTGYNTTDISLGVNAEKVVTLVVWMPDSVGNEANHATTADAPVINLGINVVATQLNSENDSFGKDYDENATYPEFVTVNSTEEFNKALDLIKKVTGDTTSKTVSITLSDNVSDAQGIQTAEGKNLTMDFANKTVQIKYTTGSLKPATCGAQFLQGSTVTLKNGTYKFDASVAAGNLLIQNYANLTLEDVALDGTGADYALSTNCGNVTIKGNTNITADSGKTALDVMHWEDRLDTSKNEYVDTSYKADGTHVVFDESMTGTVDGKISVYCWRNNSVVSSVEDGGATLVIKGGTFKNSGLTLEQFQAFVPDGYKVTNDGGVYTVTKA